eukprot:COSAG01_NODE_5485_length_4230_cov_3.169450_1_plen_204_part_00
MTDSVVVGIDLSLTSPSYCIWNKKTNSFTCYFYPSRKRNQNLCRTFELAKHQNRLSHLVNNTFTIRPLKTLKSAKTASSLQRYRTIRDDFLRILKNHGCGLQNRTCEVFLEGYAFNASRSAGASKLHELGGIIKLALLEKSIRCREIPPTTLKKRFAGSGRATKHDMFKTFVNLGFPNLMPFFFSETQLQIFICKRQGSKPKD